MRKRGLWGWGFALAALCVLTVTPAIAADKVYINGIEGFRSFAKERLIEYHGISREKSLYYINEMEWRYNNGGQIYVRT